MEKRGSLGRYQGNGAMPTYREEPGKRPVWSNAPLNDPGLKWGEGAVWWKATHAKDPLRPLEYLACREVNDEDEDLGLNHVENVQKVLQHPHLVQMVEHGFDTVDTRKETAWEYCDAGTLNRLILAQEGEGLPESFIWHTLISLLEAVVYLNTGEAVMQGDNRDPFVDISPTWRPIAHNFINPANIFYCHPRKEDGFKLPTYGHCKLGNFTKCVVFQDEDEMLMLPELLDKDVEGEYTGYEAPELSSHFAEARLSPDGVSDVWSIGAVAFTMMMGEGVWRSVMRERISDRMLSRRSKDWRTVNPNERFQRLDAMTQPHSGCTSLESILPLNYSKQLRRLVQRMLRLVDLDNDGPGRGRDPPSVFCMIVAEQYADAVARFKGTDFEDEYVLDGELEVAETVSE